MHHNAHGLAANIRALLLFCMYFFDNRVEVTVVEVPIIGFQLRSITGKTPIIKKEKKSKYKD